MSRSYKKNPGWTDHSKVTRWYKRQASKAVRQKKHFYFENLGNKKLHIRMYQSAYLCDERSIYFCCSRKKFLEVQIKEIVHYQMWRYINFTSEEKRLQKIISDAKHEVIKGFFK